MFVFTIGDVVALVCVAVSVVLWVVITAAKAWRQSRCKHDAGVSETQACDAICNKCLKNLGFIGAWKKR